jgi:hypothetical protein
MTLDRHAQQSAVFKSPFLQCPEAGISRLQINKCISGNAEH